MTHHDAMADQDARRQALDPTRSFIVQAPAGSGKTGLLVQRYLALLARVTHPEEIVAITFTRKAAAEMRQRILEALARAGDESPPDPPHARLTWDLARSALARDRTQGWQVVRHPARLRILTIDGLNSAITRLMPVVTGFGAQPGIEEADAGRMHRQAARDVLALVEGGHGWSGEVARILDHLDNHGARAENLLAEMLGRRELWLRHVADMERGHLEQSLRQALTATLAQAGHLFPMELKQGLVPLAREAANHLNDSPMRWVAAWAVRKTFPTDDPEEIPAWEGVAFLLLTGEGQWRARWTVGEGFPAESSTRNKEEKLRLKENKTRMQEIVDLLREHEPLREMLKQVRTLPDPGYGEEQWGLLDALGKLLKLGAAQLRLLFARQGKVDHAEVSMQALHALGAPGTPSVAALRLDYRLHHLLVDEFQDTSLGQFHLLERLLEGWMPGDGRTLFLVGDPMQSIYRFRQAEVGLFLRARQEGIGGVRLQPLNLEVNFRSSSDIVGWVNRVFRRAMPEREDPASGAVVYAPSLSHRGDGDGETAVTGHYFLKPGPTELRGDNPLPGVEARRVARIVAHSRRENPTGTIALLVRSRNHLKAILPELARQGLGFQAVEIDRLVDHPAVLDLAALTRALHHPADRLHWLAVLRAPWCGLTLADLLHLVGDDKAETILERMRDPQRLARLSANGQHRLMRIQTVLEAALAERRRQPLRAWVEGTWRALGGPATLRQGEALRVAEAFFTLLATMDEGGRIPDFTHFQERLNELYAPLDTTSDGLLQVMTIHKAKGLEFDTVILPGLGRPPKGETVKPLLQWMDLGASGEEGLLLAPIPAPGEGALYDFIRLRKKIQEHHENVRLLYVAATRAKSRLHLLGAVTAKEALEPQPVANSLLHLIWPTVAETPEPVVSPETEGKAEPPDPPWRRFPLDWSIPAPPPSFPFTSVDAVPGHGDPVLFDWAGEGARMVGSVTHRFLRRIAQDGVDQWNRARLANLRPALRAHLLRMGMHGEPLNLAAAAVSQALERTLDDDRGRWILSPHVDAHSEWEISGVIQGLPRRLVADRSFVDAHGVRWIVDFKTSTHQGGGREDFLDNELKRYRNQLESYAVLCAAREPRPIRLGLYFPLMQEWREWEWPSVAGAN